MRGPSGYRNAALACTAAALALLFLALDAAGIAISSVIDDPAAAADAPFWYGALSHAGVLGWGAMTGACLLAAVAVHGLEPDSPDVGFLLASALVLACVGADDALQLHEAALPRLGVPQGAVYLAYVVAGGLWLWRLGARLLTGDRVLLAVAAGAMLASAAIDVVGAGGPVEEYLKLLGVAVGLAYWVELARQLVLAATTSAGARLPRP